MYAVGARVYKYTHEPVGVATTPQVDNSRAKLSLGPMPFTGKGVLTYTVPENDHVSIAAWSVGGRVIKVLVDKNHVAGTYSIDYKPTHKLKFSGITMISGHYRKSIKVIRLKGNDFPRDY